MEHTEWLSRQNEILRTTNQNLAQFKANFMTAKRELKEAANDTGWNDDVRFGIQYAIDILNDHDCLTYYEKLCRNKQPDLDCALRE